MPPTPEKRECSKRNIDEFLLEFWLNIVRNLKIAPKSHPQFSNILLKSTTSRTKIHETAFLGVFSAPNRVHVGSRAVRARRGTRLLEPFWPNMSLQGAILGPNGDPQSFKIHIFGPRSAQGPSKNDIRKGVWKNMKI